MKILKRVFLFIFVFLSILFIKNTCFGTTITYNNWEGAPQYASIPNLELPVGTNSYVTLMNNNRNEAIVLIPYITGDYIAMHSTSSIENGTYNRFSGYSTSSSSLTDIIIYNSTFSTETSSWSEWASTVSSSVSAYAPGNVNYINKSNFNVVLYAEHYGIIGNNIISSGIPLPEGIKLTDNIFIFSRGSYQTMFLLHSSSADSYFSDTGSRVYCYSPSGTSLSFNKYTYDSSSKTFTSNGSVSNQYYNGSGKLYHYSFNDIVVSSSNYSLGSGDYFEFYNNEEYVFPYIGDTDEVLANIDDYEYTLIFPGSLSKNCLPIKFYISKYIDEAQAEAVFEIELDTLSPYYKTASNDSSEYWFEVPTSLFKNYLVTDNDYIFVLLGANEYDEYSIARQVSYKGETYVPPTDEEIQTDAIINQTQKIEEQTNAIINQTEKIEEQTEVQKNIFERIGDILSYINPLSENFFAYKLIDLLIDALKSLFVPEEGFFNNWISDINDYFSSRFGMVYSSIDFVVDFLTRLADISSNLNTDYTIHIPEFKLFDTTLIPEYSYNLADLLENETFKNIHTIYLSIIDVIMFLWLLVFARNTFAEIFGGKLLDDTFGQILDNSDSVSSMSKRAEKEIKYRGIYSARKANMQRWHNNEK